MSTYYRPTKPIKLRHIKENLDLTEIGFEVVDDEKEGNHYFIHNGNYIHYGINSQGLVIDAFRYGSNDAETVLSVLEKEYDTEWISEYEDEYWEMADEDTSVVELCISDLIENAKEGVQS